MGLDLAGWGYCSGTVFIRGTWSRGHGRLPEIKADVAWFGHTHVC